MEQLAKIHRKRGAGRRLHLGGPIRPGTRGHRPRRRRVPVEGSERSAGRRRHLGHRSRRGRRQPADLATRATHRRRLARSREPGPVCTRSRDPHHDRRRHEQPGDRRPQLPEHQLRQELHPHRLSQDRRQKSLPGSSMGRRERLHLRTQRNGGNRGIDAATVRSTRPGLAPPVSQGHPRTRADRQPPAEPPVRYGTGRRWGTRGDRAAPARPNYWWVSIEARFAAAPPMLCPSRKHTWAEASCCAPPTAMRSSGRSARSLSTTPRSPSRSSSRCAASTTQTTSWDLVAVTQSSAGRSAPTYVAFRPARHAATAKASCPSSCRTPGGRPTRTRGPVACAEAASKAAASRRWTA